MLDDPPYLATSDWNEGHELWIMDAVGVGNTFAALAYRVRDQLGRNHAKARRLVRNGQGVVTGVRTIQFSRGAR